MKDVNSSTTTLTFTAPSLPDSVFSGTIVVMVTAVNRIGMGLASDPAIAEIDGMFVHLYVLALVHGSMHVCARCVYAWMKTRVHNIKEKESVELPIRL